MLKRTRDTDEIMTARMANSFERIHLPEVIESHKAIIEEVTPHLGVDSDRATVASNFERRPPCSG